MHKNERHDITRVLEFNKMLAEKNAEEAAREYVQNPADDFNGMSNRLVEGAQAFVGKTLEYFGVRKH